MKEKLRIRKQMKLQRVIKGVLLIEVLVAILLFALGIVALIGVQANSLALTGDIQTRAEAAHFADAYLARIWGATSRNVDIVQLQNRFGSDTGSEFNEFYTKVQSVIPSALVPNITIVPDAVLPNSADVTIVIQWRDTESTMHNYTQVASIGY